MPEPRPGTGPFVHNAPIVDPKTGFPTAEFLRKWAAQTGFNGDIQALIDAVAALEVAVGVINDTSVLAGDGLTGGGKIGDGDITLALDPIQPWEPQGYVDGRPDAGLVIFRLVTKLGYGFLENAPGSRFKVQTPATGTVTLPIRNSGVDIGTVTFAMGSSNGTLTLDATAFAEYDTFEFFAPSPQDATMAGVSFLFLGYRDISNVHGSGWGYDWGNNWGGGS
jgi:hypothetical protein